MAVFIYVNDRDTAPAEEEVPGGRPKSYRDTQPDIVCHKDEHDEVGDDNLEHV